MKICTSCKESKNLKEFNRDRKRKDGLSIYCRLCGSVKAKAWVAANKEKHKAACAKWYANNKEARYRTWTKHHYKKNYGISYEDFVELLNKQKGLCAICSDVLVLMGDKSNTKAVMDHCHTTGKIRQVLCSRCNWGLGKFKDSAKLLRLAAAYLEKHH